MRLVSNNASANSGKLEATCKDANLVLGLGSAINRIEIEPKGPTPTRSERIQRKKHRGNRIQGDAME
jgi:hypothetical protein